MRFMYVIILATLLAALSCFAEGQDQMVILRLREASLDMLLKTYRVYTGDNLSSSLSSGDTGLFTIEKTLPMESVAAEIEMLLAERGVGIFVNERGQKELRKIVKSGDSVHSEVLADKLDSVRAQMLSDANVVEHSQRKVVTSQFSYAGGCNFEGKQYWSRLTITNFQNTSPFYVEGDAMKSINLREVCDSVFGYLATLGVSTSSYQVTECSVRKLHTSGINGFWYIYVLLAKNNDSVSRSVNSAAGNRELGGVILLDMKYSVIPLTPVTRTLPPSQTNQEQRNWGQSTKKQETE